MEYIHNYILIEFRGVMQLERCDIEILPSVSWLYNSQLLATS